MTWRLPHQRTYATVGEPLPGLADVPASQACQPQGRKRQYEGT
jgi:hypothetical protein